MATMKSPLATGTKYYVTDWDDGAVLETHDRPYTAKRACKDLGASPSKLQRGVMLPVAFVAADYYDWDYEVNAWSETKTSRCVFYNPSFSKKAEAVNA